MYKRIISMAPSNTEILFALGLDKEIVAVTRYCDYPDQAMKKPRIGGWLDIKEELVRQYKPDLLLTSTFVQNKVTNKYKNMGMNVVSVMPTTLVGVFNSIKKIGKLVNRETVFLDIETTGLSPKYSSITIIGLFDGIETKTMIKGINLDIPALRKELEKYKLIVTFNGASFDIPFIEKQFPGLLPNIPNLDLRTTANKIGLTGGLKKIEKHLGIKRRKIVDEFHGGDALTLWKMYRATGNDYYLKLLVEYNEEDIINLKKLAEHCIEKIKEQFKNLLPIL